MRDQDLGELLREMPREKASADFTARVLARIPEQRASRRGRRAAVACAALALAIAVALVVRDQQVTKEQARAAERIQQLRSEHEAIERELRALRALAARSEPVVELGGSGEVQFILDLTELATESETPGPRPASYQR